MGFVPVRLAAGSLLLGSALALAACGGGAPAKTGTTPHPGPATLADGQVQLTLPLNATVFANSGTPTADGTSFGAPNSWTLDAHGVPTGNVPATFGSTTVTFWVPTLGSTHKSALQITPASQAVTVTVKGAKYSELYLLEGANDGPLDLSVTPEYSGGVAGKTRTVEIDDWCTLAVGKSLSTGTVLVLEPRNRLNGQAQPAQTSCGMFGIGVPLNPAKTTTGIQFGKVQPASGNTTTSPYTYANITAATLTPA